MLATSRHKVTIEDEGYNEFCQFVCKKGIKIAIW